MKLFENQLSKIAGTVQAASAIYGLGISLAFGGQANLHDHHCKHPKSGIVDGIVNAALKGSGVSLGDCQKALARETRSLFDSVL